MLRRIVGLVCVWFATSVFAQPTAFTYQGQLNDGGTPAQGTYDFRFRLFDAATNGTLIGTSQCLDNVTVKDGVFTATIDFGNQFNTTAARFLDIQVRKDTGLDCGTGTYSLLSPRQPITAAPTATQAASAFSLSAPDGSPAKAVFVDNNGNVGIGTTTPGAPIHIASPFAVLNLQDTGPNATQAGYLSYRNATGTETAWIGFGTAGDPDFSIVNARGSGDIVLNPFSGNVGVGTASPGGKLDVRGNIKLGTSGQFFAPAGEENLRIIRGVVAANGSILAGSGFSVVHNAAGDYTINFVTGFASLPAITAAGERSASSLFVMTDGVSSTSARLVFFSKYDNAENNYDCAFHFIAIGPR